MGPTKPAVITLGKYQIRGTLGRGAMGTVFDGWDPVIGRRVAIKTVRLLDNDDPELQEGLARFKNEAQAAGRLTHPNIVGVYDYGESDETAYIVMEFVDGQSLKERLDTKEPFPLSETVRVMQQVLGGLQFSHDRGVIHRDIKPGNVMLTSDGQVKLADFGIARIESSVMTQAGTMLGTPAYMSPEQLMGQTVDSRSDIYSTGVLLYQLLTGERPFEGGLTAIIHKALNSTPPQPSEISVTAPPALDAVVARAMAKRPDDRYSNATAFAQAVREAYQRPGAAMPGIGPDADDEATMVIAARPAATRIPTPPLVPVRLPAGKSGGLRPALLAGVGVVALGLIGGGAWFALRQAPAEPSTQGAALPVTPAPPPSPVPSSEPAPVSQSAANLPASTAPQPAAESAAQPPADSAANTPVPTQAEPTRTTATVAEPAQTANPPPGRIALAPPDIVAMRNALNGLARSARCALTGFAVSTEGDVRVSGLVGAGDAYVALRHAVQDAAPGASLTWDARSIDGHYCDVLDVVRPVAQPGGSFLNLSLKDEATQLKAHDSVLPIVKLPEFPAYLLVDYFSHDGSVAHLFPLRGAANTPFAANATVRLGISAKDKVEVGPPFGTDVIVATASSVPLFAGAVREDETVKTYLPALHAAIEAAQRRNAKLAGRVLVLETVE